MSGDLWNGDVGKLERGTSSERRLDLSPGAHHHGLAAMAALVGSRVFWAKKDAVATSQL